MRYIVANDCMQTTLTVSQVIVISYIICNTPHAILVILEKFGLVSYEVHMESGEKYEQYHSWYVAFNYSFGSVLLKNALRRIVTSKVNLYRRSAFWHVSMVVETSLHSG